MERVNNRQVESIVVAVQDMRVLLGTLVVGQRNRVRVRRGDDGVVSVKIDFSSTRGRVRSSWVFALMSEAGAQFFLILTSSLSPGLCVRPPMISCESTKIWSLAMDPASGRTIL